MNNPVTIPILTRWTDCHGDHAAITAYAEITPDIHAKILAPLEARIAALEDRLNGVTKPDAPPAADASGDDAAVLAKIATAESMVFALCQPPGTAGKREWTMSIPARPDHDPDLVIADALDTAGKSIVSLRAELAAAKELHARDVDRLVGERDEHRGVHKSVSDDNLKLNARLAELKAKLADAEAALEGLVR